MTPFERLAIALRHGVIVKRKATMRYAADVSHHSVRPGDEDHFAVVPVEATDAMDAAKKVAEIAAARRYEKAGSVGFIAAASRGDGWYRASIGEQRPSNDGITLRGVTISIHVWPVE
jgi:hypothetical protein